MSDLLLNCNSCDPGVLRTNSLANVRGTEELERWRCSIRPARTESERDSPPEVAAAVPGLVRVRALLLSRNIKSDSDRSVSASVGVPGDGRLAGEPASSSSKRCLSMSGPRLGHWSLCSKCAPAFGNS